MPLLIYTLQEHSRTRLSRLTLFQSSQNRTEQNSNSLTPISPENSAILLCLKTVDFRLQSDCSTQDFRLKLYKTAVRYRF